MTGKGGETIVIPAASCEVIQFPSRKLLFPLTFYDFYKPRVVCVKLIGEY